LLWPSLAVATALQVEVRNSEVWLIRDGEKKQLTRDGKAKLQAELSPSGDRIAYCEQCPQQEHCIPSVVLLDLEGHRTGSFRPNGGACGSILYIWWTGRNAIAAECHINPSLSEYIETDLLTGQRMRDLFGYDFTRSPDGRMVAHAGWIPHFAPPFAKSNYLQIDNKTIYPLPKGMKPVEHKGLTAAPDVIRTQGPTYSGIHEFMAGLAWSPDSKRIALIDCTYDWTVTKADSANTIGEESNRRCAVAVVDMRGAVVLVPLSDIAPADLWQAHPSWTGPRQLSISIKGVTRNIAIE
jgi:hypothetical protein